MDTHESDPGKFAWYYASACDRLHRGVQRGDWMLRSTAVSYRSTGSERDVFALNVQSELEMMIADG